MSRDDGFLSRWSRRKLAPRDAPPTGPDNDAGPAGEVTGAASAEADMLSPEELARLPSVDDLTADTDLLPFLRNGVPALLRNAALRRMWSLDPAVRDYAGDARDYAYDWNTPGGVPGTGPLSPADEVDSVISRMFASRNELPAVEAESAREQPPPSPEPARLEEASASGAIVEDVEEGERAADSDTGEPVWHATAIAVPPSSAAKPLDPPSRRRHGSAIPTLE